MMKRMLCVLLLGCLLLSLSACERNGTLLHAENYGEAFRMKNAILYPNPDCEHALISSSAEKYLNEADCTRYHMTICKHGGCDYGRQFHPHSIRIGGLIMFNQVIQMTDGYLYHRYAVACADCNLRVDLYSPCEVQRLDCNTQETAKRNGCLNKNWEEILCDTPYEILYD